MLLNLQEGPKLIHRTIFQPVDDDASGLFRLLPIRPCKMSFCCDILFASITILMSAFAFLFALFMWSANRQTQFRRSKSKISRPNSNFGAPKNEFTCSTKKFNFHTDSGGKDIIVHGASGGSVTQHKCHIHDSNSDADEDDTFEETFPLDNSHPMLADEENIQELLSIMKEVKILSYLSEPALLDLLSYVEYLDLVDSGLISVDRSATEWDQLIDEALYVVLSGSVRCKCCMMLNNRSVDETFQPLLFVAAPGDVITSQLAVLSGLIHEYARRNPMYTANLTESINYVCTYIQRLEANSRLIRIPSACFVHLLEHYPQDIHRIARSIFSRIQRVTIQTLVNKLGLGVDEFLSYGKKNRLIRSRVKWNSSSSPLDPGIQRSLAVLHDRDARAIAVAVTQALGSSRDIDIALIQESSFIVSYPPGTSLLEVGSTTEYLYYILDGDVSVEIMFNDENKLFTDRRTEALNGSQGSSKHVSRPLCKLGMGEIVGNFGIFTAEISIISIQTCTQTTLVQIPRHIYEKLLDIPGILVDGLRSILSEVLSPLTHLLDWGADWLHLAAGEVLVRKGQPCESLFIVLNGRLRERNSNSEPNGYDYVREEFGRGSCIGDVQILTEATWHYDIFAIRNSELAILPKYVLELLWSKFPTSGFHFAKVIAKRVQTIYERRTSQTRSLSGAMNITQDLSVGTIAVVPFTFSSKCDFCTVSEFCENLKITMDDIAPSTLVSKRILRQSDGNHRLLLNRIKVSQMLGDLEENYRIVVFEADFHINPWTRLCIGQADCILLLACADTAPDSGAIDEYLQAVFKSMNVRIELVVLHRQGTGSATASISHSLNRWSEQRPWITRHHIVRLPYNKNVLDLKRLCRRVTGCSVGLVLGGGGARGLAHLGVIKALIEAGITVDMVGGCSQGALIGAIYAMYPNPEDFGLVIHASKKMAKEMSSVKNKLLDLTFPVVSYFNGRRFNQIISNVVGAKTRLQDLPLTFFCVSVDVCNNIQKVHTKGLCWKYLRASMSLHSYLPPVSEKGSLLLDGGYVNVVPADIMSQDMGATTVIAVDVSGEYSDVYYEYGTHLSGWWILWNSWNPFVKTVKIASMGDLSQKLIWVSSTRQLKKVTTLADLLLVPPVQHYGTLDYDKFDEIVQIGYEYAKQALDEFTKRIPRSVK